ncbi:MAG: nucleotidyltransferase domain-containing protein [Eggerthellaceae bacterium]|nr:nucleotidyltransferase domain-containing protein [Eggerthellaceae bacterium]
MLKEPGYVKMVYDLALLFGVEAQKLHPRSYVCLFGSHAKGTARPNSGVDIAVIVERIDGQRAL